MLNFSKNCKRILALTLIAMLLPIFSFAATPKGNEITKAEFIAKISEYFAWPHPTEYNDIWKAPLKQFNDVKTEDKYGKQIEVAYEEGIISPDASGNFNPENGISRQDAAVIFVKAFMISESDKDVNFSDSDDISVDARGSVNALVELGYMSGKTHKLFRPNDLIKKEEVDRIFDKITSVMVTPVQALPKQHNNIELFAPRRYVKLYCPTPDATIYFTKTIATDIDEIQEPPMPDITDPDQIYTVVDDGHIKEDYSRNVHTYVVYKAVAVKDGMAISPVQTFTWNLHRPEDADFGHELILEKTATSPAVYQLYNNSESVRAMAWYIEGQESGILFDALQTKINIKNLKDYIDANIVTKPYDVIIGHAHPDHAVQVPNFINDHDVYSNERGWGSLTRYLPDPVDQAKVKNIEEGDLFHLGGCDLSVYAMPGHADDNIILQDKANGLIFSSDIYGCTRAGSADNVGVLRGGMKVDILLSLAQQTYSNYKKDGGKTTMLFTGHDEYPLGDNNLKLFEAALQQVVDKGEDGCSPTLRGGNNAPYSRTTLIGDMWKDGTNWISLQLSGIMGDDTEYLTNNAAANYNGEDGFMQYSVLSNIEIDGGELVGKPLAWAPPSEVNYAGETIIVEKSLQNKFDPWSYDYTIKVPTSNENITIIPTTMSTMVKSIRLNGKKIEYRSSNTIPVSDGTVITIDIIAPDKITTSTYTFTVDKISE